MQDHKSVSDIGAGMLITCQFLLSVDPRFVNSEACRHLTKMVRSKLKNLDLSTV